MRIKMKVLVGLLLVLVICTNMSVFKVDAATKKNGLSKPIMISCKNTTPDWSKVPMQYRATGTTYTLKWKKVSGAKGYQVQVCEREWGEYSWGPSYYGMTSKTNYSVSASSIDKFRIRVRAYKVKNGKKVYGPWGKWVVRDFK